MTYHFVVANVTTWSVQLVVCGNVNAWSESVVFWLCIMVVGWSGQLTLQWRSHAGRASYTSAQHWHIQCGRKTHLLGEPGDRPGCSYVTVLLSVCLIDLVYNIKWTPRNPLLRLIDWLIDWLTTDRSIDRLFQLDHVFANRPLNVPVKLACFCSASHLRVSHFAILQPVARQDLHLAYALQGNLHSGNHDGGVESIAPKGQDEREVQGNFCCRLAPQEQ